MSIYSIKNYSKIAVKFLQRPLKGLEYAFVVKEDEGTEYFITKYENEHYEIKYDGNSTLIIDSNDCVQSSDNYDKCDGRLYNQ